MRAWRSSSSRHSSTSSRSAIPIIGGHCTRRVHLMQYSQYDRTIFACACTLPPMRSSPTPAAPHWEPSTWALLAVLCGVLFLDGLDVSMVGMALPSIREELGLTTSQLQWVVSGYVLGYGGLLLLGGRAADLLGRRRVLIVGLSVFVVASAVGGLVNDGTLLVVTRVLKGMSAAFTAPAGLLDHHHHVLRGPEPQPGARLLHRHRSQRLLARPRVRRSADRARLALDVPAPGAVRARDPAPRAAGDPARPADPGCASGATTSPAR